MEKVKIGYEEEDWGNAEVEGLTFMRPEAALGTMFPGFVARRGAKAKAVSMKLDDLKGLRFMMEMKNIQWRHLTFEMGGILYQLVKFQAVEENTLRECRFLVIGPK